MLMPTSNVSIYTYSAYDPLVYHSKMPETEQKFIYIGAIST